MGELVPAAALGALAPALPLSAEALDYAREATSVNTRRAYRAAWADFTTWCEANGRTALPAAPETVGTYLAARASSLRVSTLGLRLVAIGQAHRLAGHRIDVGHPAIRKTLQGIRAVHGSAPRKKDAAVATVIRDMADVLSKLPGLRAVRDRALLLVGFAAALRRSELVALNVQDLAFVSEGLVVTIRRAKTDQEGRGAEIGIPFGSSERTCPVLALRAWLNAASIEAGAVFRGVNRHGGLGAARLSDRDVARVVKACVEAAGYDPTTFAGHSLRSGFITTAARAGVPACRRAGSPHPEPESAQVPPRAAGLHPAGQPVRGQCGGAGGVVTTQLRRAPAYSYCGHPLSRSPVCGRAGGDRFDPSIPCSSQPDHSSRRGQGGPGHSERSCAQRNSASTRPRLSRSAGQRHQRKPCGSRGQTADAWRGTVRARKSRCQVPRGDSWLPDGRAGTAGGGKGGAGRP